MTEEKIRFYEKELYTPDYTPEPETILQAIIFPKVPQQLRILLFIGTDAEAEAAEKEIDATEAKQQEIIAGIFSRLQDGTITAAFTGDYNGGNFKLLTLDTHRPGIRITYFYKHLPTCHNSDMTPGKVADVFNSSGKIYIV